MSSDPLALRPALPREVDAGHAPSHGPSVPGEQAEPEAKAAERVFGVLPRPEGDAPLALQRERGTRAWRRTDSPRRPS